MVKKSIQSIVLVFIGFSLFNCTPNAIPAQSQAVYIDTLGIYVSYGESLSDQSVDGYDLEVARMIKRVNADPSYSFKVKRLERAEGEFFIDVNVLGQKMVTPEQKAAGVLLTTLGIITPIALISGNAGFYVAFWYLPKDVTYVETHFSSSLSYFELKKPQGMLLSGSYINLETRNYRVKTQFSNFINNSVNAINRSKISGLQR